MIKNKEIAQALSARLSELMKRVEAMDNTQIRSLGG